MALRQAFGLAMRPFRCMAVTLNPYQRQTNKLALLCYPPYRFNSTQTKIRKSSYNGMSEVGLTESQIEVKRSINKICKEFPDEYWAEKDQKSEYAGDLHNRLAEQGYLGICMPESLGRSRH